MSDLKKINLMIVDDESEILSSLEKYFNRLDNYKVTTYTNPLNAIAAVKKETDVVLLDIMMPQMNGIDAIDNFLAKNKDLKIIMMTAYSTLDKVLNSHRGGAVDYIMKPFPSLKEIEKKINALFK
jgi:DNA-binding NtrC family response regulator